MLRTRGRQSFPPPAPSTVWTGVPKRPCGHVPRGSPPGSLTFPRALLSRDEQPEQQASLQRRRRATSAAKGKREGCPARDAVQTARGHGFLRTLNETLPRPSCCCCRRRRQQRPAPFFPLPYNAEGSPGNGAPLFRSCPFSKRRFPANPRGIRSTARALASNSWLPPFQRKDKGLDFPRPPPSALDGLLQAEMGKGRGGDAARTQ